MRKSFSVSAIRFRNYLMGLLSDRQLIRLKYFFIFRRFPDLDHPKTYNEKIQALKLIQTDPIFSELSDKFAVRDFIAEKIGKSVLVELYWQGKSARDIPFETLPEKFVIKCAHGTSFNIFVRDKAALDIPETVRTLDQWMGVDYSIAGRELHYRNIEPRIIVEELLEDPLFPVIVDYKIHCFDGEPDFIQIDIGRFGDHRRIFIDPKGNRLDFYMGNQPGYEGMFDLPKPERLETMVGYARLLSAGFPLMRVDLYCVSDRIYF
jgi:hypothetical protein